MGVRSTLSAALRYFTESRSVAAPNATVPVHSFTAKGSETDVDACFVAKGDGAILAQVPDGTTVGGDKRGNKAVDLQMFRLAASNVASGSLSTISGGSANTASADNSAVSGGDNNVASGFNSSVGGGGSNTASGSFARVGGGADNDATGDSSVVAGGSANTASGTGSCVCGGEVNTASGNKSAVLGGDSNEAGGQNSSVLGGTENGASGIGSVAMGSGGYARHFCEFAQGNGLAQHGSMVMVAQTTNNTPTQMTFDGTNMILPLTDEVWGIRARVVARCKSNSKAWVTDLEFAVTNFGGTLVQLGTTDIGLDKKTGSTTWTASVYVSGDNVSITVTGANSETVDWSVDFWYGRIGQAGV